MDPGTSACAAGTAARIDFPFPAGGPAERIKPHLLRASDGALYVALSRSRSDDVWLSRSLDNGATWSVGTRIHGGQVGAIRARPLLDETAGELVFLSAEDDRMFIQGARLDGSEAGATATAVLPSEGGLFPSLARHSNGALVAVSMELAFGGHRLLARSAAPGTDPSDAASWSAESLVDLGTDPSLTHSAAGALLADARDGLGVRRFDGAAFGPRVLLESGFMSATAATTSPFGVIGVAYRRAAERGDSSLRLARSADEGATYGLATIAAGRESFNGLEVALGADGEGFATWHDEGTVHMTDTSPIADPVYTPPPPYRGRLISGRFRLPGGLLRLRAPARCLEDLQEYRLLVDVQRRRGARGRRPRISRVDFFKNDRRVARDRRSPFRATFTAESGRSVNSFVILHRVVVRVRAGGRNLTRTFNARLDICVR